MKIREVPFLIIQRILRKETSLIVILSQKR